MRRIGRWMLNGFTALSLLLCAATCSLWVRSYRFMGDYALARYGCCGASVSVEQGSIRACVLRLDRYRLSPLTVETSLLSKNPADVLGAYITEHPLLGWEPHSSSNVRIPTFAAGSREGLFGGFRSSSAPPRDYRYWYVIAPCWTWALLLTALPVARGWRPLCRTRQCPPGLCPACGYDLRATPDKCPECGRVPT